MRNFHFWRPLLVKGHGVILFSRKRPIGRTKRTGDKVSGRKRKKKEKKEIG